MSLARRWANEQRAAMPSMEDILVMPFDQLWSHTERSMPATSGRQMLPPVHGDSHLPAFDVQQYASHTSFDVVEDSDLQPEEQEMYAQHWQPMSHFHRERHRHADALHSYAHLSQLDEDRVLRGVKPRTMKQLKTRTATKDDGKHQCNICMDTFRPSCQILSLPCKHSFCKPCVSQWLEKHDTCPVCRWKFPESQTQLININ